MIKNIGGKVLALGLFLVALRLLFVTLTSPFLGDTTGTVFIYLAAILAFPTIRLFIFRRGSLKITFAFFTVAVIAITSFGLPRLIRYLDLKSKSFSNENGFKQRAGMIRNPVVRNEFANFKYPGEISRTIFLQQTLGQKTSLDRAGAQDIFYIRAETILMSKLYNLFTKQILQTCSTSSSKEQLECFKNTFKDVTENVGLSPIGHALMLRTGIIVFLNISKVQHSETAKNERREALLSLFDLALEQSKFIRSVEQLILFPSSVASREELEAVETINRKAKAEHKRLLLAKYEMIFNQLKLDQREPASSLDLMNYYQEKLQKFKSELGDLNQEILKADDDFSKAYDRLKKTFDLINPSEN
jgi:hypothetical protein